MNRPRVVVTGMGVVSPAGWDLETFWSHLLELRVPIGRLQGFSTEGLRTRIAAQIRGLELEAFLDRRTVRRYDRHALYAAIAGQQALEASGLDLEREDRDRIGVIVGSAHGAIGAIQAQFETIASRNGNPWADAMSPYAMPHASQNTAASALAIRHGLRGPNTCVFTACAAGAHAIGEAAEKIQIGKADVMLAGGADASITRYCIHGYSKIGAMSSHNEDPLRALRPFDRTRDGFVMGEGSAILVLEEEDHARRRGARIHGEIAGYGLANDATHLTNISEEGRGIRASMTAALRDAGVDAAQIDYVSTHGSGTIINDRCETRAIHAALGARATKIPCNSTKPLTGHMMGAAGAVETIITLLQMREGLLLPTVNLRHPDPDCDLDYVPDKPRRGRIRIALNNAVGFGGPDATLVLRATPRKR